MIVLSEAGLLGPSASAATIARITEVARLLGFDVYTTPPDFEDCETADNALWHIPPRDARTPATWVGFLPAVERYSAIYAAALSKNIELLNNPQAHRIAMEFDLAYPYLAGLTPESTVVRSEAECAEAGETVGYPMFLKGAVQSRKLLAP
jgi:hypothetical protein